MTGLLSRGLVRAAAVAAALLLAAGAAGIVAPGPGFAIGLALAVLFGAEAWLSASRPPRATSRPATAPREALLDTSVLIDGRIADICATGFVAFDVVAPEFVLRELQHVADSADPGRRARGRRGLDVLQTLGTSRRVRLIVTADDVPAEREVDHKLVALARARGAALLTNDFNLNKVAAIQGITVLSVNDLARALRPAMLPGETLRVTILKEGKEPGQGVAYLDDGTMVVVDQARALQGSTVDVVVTSAIQTAAGKMFFARLAE